MLEIFALPVYNAALTVVIGGYCMASGVIIVIINVIIESVLLTFSDSNARLLG